MNTPRGITRRVATIPRPQTGRVVRDIIRGFPRWVRRDSGQLDEERANAYFLKRSFEDDQCLVVEASIDWYAAILDASDALRQRLTNGERAALLDVGCGRGGLLRWLETRGYQSYDYLGVDRDSIAIKRCAEKFPGRDFSTGAAGELAAVAPKGADIFFIINVLPYLGDPLAGLRVCRSLARRADSLLVVVDPTVSPYWNHEFSGVRPQYRTTAKLLRLTTEAGWAPRELVHLAPAALFGVPILGIAHLVVASPKA